MKTVNEILQKFKIIVKQTNDYITKFYLGNIFNC